MAAIKPNWLELAESHVGTKEIPGITHEPKILSWWKWIKRGGIKSDEVPWCAAFVGAMFEQVGIPSSRFESARSYLAWGDPISVPIIGCVAVFERDGGGHVGFVVGVDEAGNLSILGGNQGNQVSVRLFGRDRLLSLRWPSGIPMHYAKAGHLLSDRSTTEA